MHIIKQSLRLSLVFFCSLFCFTLSIAQQKGDSATKNTTSQTTTAGGGDAAKGKELFVANCKNCHAITSEVVIWPWITRS